jgi:hypothetical protein
MITAAGEFPAKMLSVRPSAYQPTIYKGDINPCVPFSKCYEAAKHNRIDPVPSDARKGIINDADMETAAGDRKSVIGSETMVVL